MERSPNNQTDRTARPAAHRSREHVDALVVGVGPAGAIAALEIARAGHRVVAIDQRPSSQQRLRSGALLSPRALHALEQQQIALGTLETAHRISRLRVTAAQDPSHSASLAWPTDVSTGDGGVYPDYALVVDRHEFDRLLADAAIAQGADVRYGIHAVAPLVERGFVRGAEIAHVGDGIGDLEDHSTHKGPCNPTTGETHDTISASYTVVADGANSRFGRALGTLRHPDWPYALGHRGRYRSDLSNTDEVEFVIGLRDRSGDPIAGHAWLIPCGDGTVVVGVLINSTSPSFRVIRPERLLDRVVETFGDRWGLDPTPTSPTAGSRLPLGTSIQPVAGPTFLLAGDAAGAANPITGSGIDYALETGGLAAGVLDRALQRGVSSELQRYPELIRQRYATYYKLGRLSTRLFGSSSVVSRGASYVARESWASAPLLRLAAHELRPSNVGFAELAVRGTQLLDPILPSS